MAYQDYGIPPWLGQEGHEESTKMWLEDHTFRFPDSGPLPSLSSARSLQQLYTPPPKTDLTLKIEQTQYHSTNADSQFGSQNYYHDEIREARVPSPETARLDEELRAEQGRYNSWRRTWRDRLDPGELPIWFGKDECALWTEWWMEDENLAAADLESPIS